MNNIFKFATSELSQDALLCYWFNFVTENHFNESIEGRISAQKLISLIINDHTGANLNYKDIKVNQIEKQYENMDILMLVNSKYFILIEDKLYTSEHGNQIDRYLEFLTSSDNSNELREKFKVPSNEPIPIPVYFKMIDQSKYDLNRYVLINRKNVLNILNDYTFSDTPIMKMFKEHISEIDNQVNNFNKTPYTEWEYSHFLGFYSKLKSLLNIHDDDWGFGNVSNRNGGFTGCWWYHHSTSDCLLKMGISSRAIKDIYLQIEKNSRKEFQLAIKMKYVPFDAKEDKLIFLKDIETIDAHFANTNAFNKKYRAAFFPNKTNSKLSKDRFVTLFKSPLHDLNNFDEIIKICEMGQEALNNLSSD